MPWPPSGADTAPPMMAHGGPKRDYKRKNRKEDKPMAIYKIQGENPEVFNGEHFNRRVRVEYACDYTAAEIEALLPEMVHRFKVMDDDGETYFWGVCSDPNSFAPLDQEGAEYGATAIAYKNRKTGEYEEL